MPIFKQDGGSNKQWGEISTSGRTWLFVTEEIPVNTVSLRFENPQYRMFEEGEADNTGGIQLTFGELDCVFAQVNDLSGDIVATAESLTCTGTGIVIGITADLELNFVEPIISMQAGLGVSCFFEPFEISMGEAVNMADMNVEFKEPDLLFSGENTYVYMQLDMKKLEGSLISGAHLTGTVEGLTCEITGMSGKVASLRAVGLPITADLVGGPLPYMDLEFKEPTFLGSGTPPESNSITVTFKKGDIVLTAKEARQAILDARFNQMALTLAGENHPVGSVSITFLPLSFAGEEGSQRITAELEGMISYLRMMAELRLDGPNSMDLEFIPHDILITDDGGGCALADTLTYGG